MALAVGACSSLSGFPSLSSFPGLSGFPGFSGGRQIWLPELPKSAEANSPSVREQQRVLSAYGGAYENPRLHAELTNLLARLTAVSERPDIHYKITILNSPAVNAFALPNGQLYVTRGLLALANDRAEVAAVMSHEMAHVIKGHAALREEMARATELSSGASDSSSGSPLSLARSKIIRAGTLASFSQKQEMEADTLGVGIAARAGFDPMGASRLLNSMERNAELHGAHDTRASDFMSTHPSTPERVRNVKAVAQRLAAAPGARKERDKAAYLASINGMKYGDDTEEGFVLGRQFIHPKLDFTFMAPEGFVLDNTAQAVLGSKESAGQVLQALRLDVVKIPSDQSLVDYLKSGWMENIDDSSVSELRVNGNPAATATASGDPWSFRIYVVKLGNEVYRFVFAAKNLTKEADAAFHVSVQTFRRLTEREKAARPLHVQVVKVKPGDTVDSLAAGMIFADHQVERFEVLNGLDPARASAELKPGGFVKIIVE